MGESLTHGEVNFSHTARGVCIERGVRDISGYLNCFESRSSRVRGGFEAGLKQTGLSL